MSGLDKIIEHIELSANETATEIINSAKAEAESYVREGKAEAEAKADEILKKAQLDVMTVNKKIQSESDLAQKRFILKAKREVVDEVFNVALQRLKSLDDKDYFELLLIMISKYAGSRPGTIMLAEKDLRRMPENFEQRVSDALKGKAQLSISTTAVNIEGGFILSYGDIEENCSFDALFENSKEELQDKIGQIIFA